ncbi:MAG: radical SAM protein [Thermoleophilia bacterium]|nr:radical SAM protein [Thermoleophilia bacterium]
MDTRATAIPGFVAKAAAAGCDQVFVGVESLNEANLVAAGKHHNRAGEFREMVEAWHRAHVAVQAGYIIGMPHDTPDSVRRDIAALRDTVRVDHASFFMFTPIPGSRDHRRMVAEKVPLDADLNNYDSFHETFRHPHFAPGEWRAAYREAWETFYTKERIVDTLLRTPADRYWNVFWHSLWTRYAMQLGTHPMVTGFVRRRERRARRPGFGVVSRPRFLWERAMDALFQARGVLRLFFEFQEIWLLTRKRKDPRWSTLAALRERWLEMKRRIAESQPAVRAEVAARELRTTLQSASEQLRQLLEAGRSTHRRLRRRLREKRREIESFLENFDWRMPSLPRLSQAERYVRENLLAGYEEVAIRYVAARRRLNTWRHDLLGRLRRGRLFTLGYLRMPGAVVAELFLGLRFGFSFLRNV